MTATPSRNEEYAAYLASPEWRKRRNEAVKRAEGRCQLCNASKRLNVHHRTYERVGHERKMDLTVLCAKCHEHFHHITGGAEKRLKSAPKPRKQPKRPHHLRPLKSSPEAYQPKVPRPNAKMRELVERSVKEWPKGEPFNAKPIARRVRERDRKHKITDALVARALEWFEEQGELERIGGQRWQR